MDQILELNDARPNHKLHPLQSLGTTNGHLQLVSKFGGQMPKATERKRPNHTSERMPEDITRLNTIDRRSGSNKLERSLVDWIGLGRDMVCVDVGDGETRLHSKRC